MKNENHCFGLSIYCKMLAVYLPWSVTIFNHISGTICKYGMQLHRLVHRIYRQCISNKKNVSVFEILELCHETSQVAASQCEVCDGSLETPAHVVDFWKIDTL